MRRNLKRTCCIGWVAEWFKAPVLKTGVRETVPGVRIPPQPLTEKLRVESRGPEFGSKEIAMLSARNQFKGIVKEVKLGNVMAEVVISVGSIEIVSAITRSSAEKLGLKPGDTVMAIIKSTEVMIDK
jgi:molybdopterin-binding protein